MKTVDEVARNIFNNVHQYAVGVHQYAVGMDTENVVSSIADSLNDYAQQRVDEALDKMAWGFLQRDARNQALEDAAKFIESKNFDGCESAEQIRALKEKP